MFTSMQRRAIGTRSSAASLQSAPHRLHADVRVYSTSARAQQPMQQEQEAQLLQAAFNASLERIVGALPGSADSSVEEIGRLALLHSTQRRFSRTHMNTVNMSTEEDDCPASICEQLPLSQLAFKALLRASLAAARLNHRYLTTPHILLGLLAAVGAAASLMTQSRGLDAVAWCGELSARAQAVLLSAEQLRQQTGRWRQLSLLLAAA
ncbi:hypothetical protein COO60DRAFT_1625312 [Scenedesmus sp. NREL 46B-D3]|nr:hypothetical protein COO60DRAFT_1625312 [Scenedesmus sp. NREL 46B-D3]